MPVSAIVCELISFVKICIVMHQPLGGMDLIISAGYFEDSLIFEAMSNAAMVRPKR